MDTTLYINYSKNKNEFINLLISFLGKCDISFNTIIYKDFEFLISYNDEYNENKAIEFPDVFLYFKYLLDIEYSGENENLFIDMLNKVLKFLWDSNIASIASSDYEESLVENGGYKSKNIPWPI